MKPRKLQCCIRKPQSNRVSDLRDFVCSLFPKQSILTFIKPVYLARNLTLNSDATPNYKC